MISENTIVEKSNQLNEAVMIDGKLTAPDELLTLSNTVSLQEARFLAIYLSRIDARQPERREVEFALDEFCTIMEVTKVNIAAVKELARRLLDKKVIITLTSGGFTAFSLFSVFTLDCNPKTGKWTVLIKCSEEAVPLLYNFKNKYFSYRVGNVLRLKSTNQIRMYEILKQYEGVGERTIELAELKRQLGIGANDYSRFHNFKTKVLDACRIALIENTDIRYDYELIRRGRAVSSIRFTIEHNELSPAGILQLNVESGEDNGDQDDDRYKALISLLSDACNGEFSDEQIEELQNLARRHITRHDTEEHFNSMDLTLYHFLRDKYLKLNAAQGVKNRYAYMKTLVKENYE